MKRALALLAALLLLVALPVAAQQPVPPAGAVVVGVFRSSGTDLVLVDSSIVAPAVCLPEDVS